MKKYLLFIFLSSFLFFGNFQLKAQCPTVAGTTINTCDFSTGGVINIIFTDGGSSEHQNYILFNVNGPTAVSAPFGPVTKSYDAGTQTLTFGNIPDGTYLAANSTDGCPALGGTGIQIDQTNELILSIDNVSDDCDNLGLGEINLTTSGGDAPFSYSWSGALPDQEDQDNLTSGTYDVTVTDSDNCTFILTGIVVEAGPVDQTISNLDPTDLCAGDDLVINIDGSETGVNYTAYVAGLNSGASTTGNGGPISITVPSGSFNDGDNITVQADDSNCPAIFLTDNFDVNITTIVDQTISNTDPTALCSGDDLVVALDGSEVGVNYQVFVGATGSTIEAGTGAALNITVPSAALVDGANITVEGTTGSCSFIMTDNFDVNITTIVDQTISNTDPTVVCSGDDLVVALDGSEVGVNYQVFVGATGSTIEAGTGAALNITVPSAALVDGANITVEATSGACSLTLTDNFDVSISTVLVQNISNSNPADICAGDDLVVSLDNSQNGVTYTVFVGGVASTASVVSTGGQLDITLPSAEFNDGDNITVEGTIGGCPAVAMTNPFDANIVDFTLNPTITNTTGCAINDGAIDLTPNSDSSGDTFSFSWVGPNSFTSLSQNISGLDGGSYTVTITSLNSGCTFDSTIVVDDPLPYTINVTSINPQQTCGGSDGGIDINITGGTGPYNYYIVDTNTNTEVASSRSDNDAADTYSYNLLPPGDYEVFVEEGACTESQPFTVDPVIPIAVSIDSETPASCGGADGTITLAVSDFVSDYEVIVNAGTPALVSPGTALYTISGLAFGTYSIELRDVTTNCSITITEDVEENAPFGIDNTATEANITNIQTCGGSEGAIDVVLTGAALTGFETFTWTGPFGFADPGTEDLTGLNLAGDYQLTIEDAGCRVVSDVYTITEPVPPSAGDYTGVVAQITPTNPIYDLTNSLDGSQVNNGIWSDTDGSGADINGNIVDFSGVPEGIYTFTYTVESIPSCTDSEDVVVEFLNFECDDTQFTTLTEDATCQGVQDGSIFLFMQNVSNVPSFEVTINSVVMDTFSIQVANPGNGGLVQIDTAFFSGNYQLILKDLSNNCADTTSVLVGQKQSIIPLVNTSDATCDNPVGQIQVTINGSFDFILLDSLDAEIETNTTGLFTDLSPATYGIAFTNSGGCQVDTVKNIIINEPTQVSNSALDLTVVEPTCNTTRAQIIVNFELGGEYFYQILDTAGVVVDSITTDLGEWTTELDTLGLFELVVSNVDNPGVCEPNSRNFNIERSGGFTATVIDKTDVVCFGSNTGSVTIELDGIASGFYSLDGGIWTEFISGEPITNLPARNNILVSDAPGNSACELSVNVDIGQPASSFVLDGDITTIRSASCTAAESIGEIQLPAIIGGVEPLSYFVNGFSVEPTPDGKIVGLSRDASILLIEDANGCSIQRDISRAVSPNEITYTIEEIGEDNNCISAPEGILLTIDAETIRRVDSPYTFIINKENEAETTEFDIEPIDENDNEFQFGPGQEFEYEFERGTRYIYTLISLSNEEACSRNISDVISGGAIIPTFEIEGIDAACSDGSGALRLFNISGDSDLPIEYQIFEGNSAEPTITIEEAGIPLSGEFEINADNYGSAMGFVSGGYNVRLVQRPLNCSEAITSDSRNAVIETPTGSLLVELVPEPLLPPDVERDRNSTNPKPTTRRDKSDGSISIRIAGESGAENYYALLSLAQNGRISGAAPYIFEEDTVELFPGEVYTFDNLSAGTYIIEYFDSFGRCAESVRIVRDSEGSVDGIYVGFDETPFIPNVFTPNNDGKNDFFEILNLPDNGAELIVTNRTGTIVYRDDNYRTSNLWDGGDSPDGIYFYQLTVDGSVQNGWVEIIRGKR
jgi:hypothetical protein